MNNKYFDPSVGPLEWPMVRRLCSCNACMTSTVLQQFSELALSPVFDMRGLLSADSRGRT